MSRVGRPRKAPVTLAGKTPAIEPKSHGRYPCGKQRPIRERNAISPAHIQRIVLLARNKAVDPIFETPLGILRLQGELTDTQTAAALEYARLRGRADRVLGLKARSARSPSYETGYSGSAGVSGDRLANDKANEIFEKLREPLQNMLVMSGGYRSTITMVDLLDRVCVDGLSVESTYFDSFRAGLTACAIFFGMTRKRS